MRQSYVGLLNSVEDMRERTDTIGYPMLESNKLLPAKQHIFKWSEGIRTPDLRRAKAAPRFAGAF